MDSEVPTSSSNQKHLQKKNDLKCESGAQNNQEITGMNNCSTPEIEAPLSPVLSNSKQSLRLIAKRKSRIKLLNKFSQSSLVSQETLTPLQIQTRIELNEPSLSIANSNILEDISNVKQNSIKNINPTSPLITKTKIVKEILDVKQDAIEKISNKDNALEERMKRCIEIQKNKKFCYNIAKSSSNLLSTSENTESSSLVIKVLDFPQTEKSKSYDVIKPVLLNNSECKKETDFNFKIPISPVSATKLKKSKLETVTNYKQNINVGFETGRGKKIKLSEIALKRASKLFDDILDIPSESSNIPNSSNKKSEDEKIVIIKNKNISNLGFKTASGNALKLSENSLKKVSNLFDDIYDLSNYTETSTKTEVKENVEIDMCIKKSSDASKAPTNTLNEHFKQPSQIIETKLDNKINEVISPDNKNVFTQITDTQMCWAADNAECLAEFMDSQWTPSPKDKLQQKTQQSGVKNINKTLDDMEGFLSPEAEQLFGNLTVCEDGTVASRKSIQLDNRNSSIASENADKSIDNSDVSSFRFSTSDKKIISTESLNNTENIFQDCDDVYDKNNEEESLNKVRNRAQNYDKNNDNVEKNEFSTICDELDEKIKTPKNISTYGFITASGKQVEISEESLKSAKKLLDCDIEDHNETFDETLLTPINSETRIIKSEDAFILGLNLDKNIFVPSEEIQERSNKKMHLDCAMASSNFNSSDKFSYNTENTLSNEKDKNCMIKREIIFEEIQFDLDNNDEDFICCGFTWNEALKSLKILELYKRSFKLIENDLKKNDFRPISLIFSNTRSSQGYRKKSYKSRKKNVYESCGTPELFNTSTNMLTRSRRKTDISCTPLVVIDLPEITRSKRKSKGNTDNSQENISTESTTSSEKSTPDIYIDKVVNNNKSDYKTIQKLEDDFLFNLENTLKETKNISDTVLTCDVNSFKEEFSEEANFDNTIINSRVKIEQNTSEFQLSTEPFLKVSQNFVTKTNINYDMPIKENITKNTEIKLENSSTAFDVNISFSIESNKSLLTKNEKKQFDVCKNNEDLANKITGSLTSESSMKPDFSKVSNNENNSKESINKYQIEKENLYNLKTPKNDLRLEFSTGLGTTIEVTEENLKKAKNIFQDCDISENIKFCTPKSVDKIEDSLNITNNFSYISKEYETPKNIAPLGFSTASGKKITISEEALKKTKDIFVDCCNTEKNINKNIGSPKETYFDFATVSRENIATSEESLNKGKDIFKDYNIPKDISNKNTESLKNRSLGFSTASGKKVEICEESLKKAKNIFEDCNVTKENFNESPKNNIFEDFNITEKNCDNIATVKSTFSFGFATASGKKVAISEESLKKAKNIFEECNVAEEITKINTETPKNPQSFGFATASGKKVAISEESVKKAKNLFDDCSVTEDILIKNTETPKSAQSFGFATASGKQVAISEEFLKKAKNLFDDCTVTEDILIKNTETSKSAHSFGFATASGKKVAISEESLKKAKNIFEDCNITEEIPDNTETLKNMSVFGFATASGKKVVVSDDALEKARNIFEDINETSTENSLKDTNYPIDESLSTPTTTKKSGFKKTSERKVIISEEMLNKSRNISVDVNSMNMSEHADENTPNSKHFEQKMEVNHSSKPKIINRTNSSSAITTNKSYSSPQVSSNDSTPILRNKSLSIRNSKKRSLGVTSCRQIDIPENNLKRAKLVFDDVDTPKTKQPNTNYNNVLNNSPSYNKTNTPQKVISKSSATTNISTHNKSLLNSTVTMKESNQIKSSINITPTKKSPMKTFCFGNEQESAAFVFQARTPGDSNKWKLDLQKELDMLRLKMSVIETRMAMLNKQQEIIQNGSSEHCRQRPGHLFIQKLNSSNKISLKEIANNRRPGKNTQQICLNLGLDPTLLDINAQNSSSLHFYVPWFPNDNCSYPAVIRSEDGAVIIPNQSNYVGVSEIEQAFLAMPGVDPKLLPKKWIPNHFRWIVWKLASLERNYPDKFNNCLTVENVLGQLKYRYDREIDRAQRSAIRKIVECDDIAAKRMVLCIATIIKLSENKYELELTDGWYSIQTMLDVPLNSLVERNVIQIGMKLATQGAELLNCEGCCPLELPANARLQIHYNSTRRAAWHVKLGYQPNPGPLRISLRMVAGNGGPVGGVTVYVARVYPISFMERSDVVVRWRNERAELRRANQWDAAYTNTMETMQMRVQQELEEEWAAEQKKNRTKRLKIKDVDGVLCGRTLYQFIEDSNDPDRVEELLTSAQISALRNYQTELNVERQSELTSRLRQKLASEKIQARNVSTVLKLCLVDVNSSYHHRMLSVWRPTEIHMQMLKENIVLNIYNVTAKNNGTLSSMPRTQFEVDANINTSKFENLDRYVLPISQTCNLELKPQFGEFDTIGMVVTIDVQQTGQILWLADERYRFLRIKIREGPETCSLFEGISPGKLVAVLNLIHQKPFKSYGEATGNLYTVLSSYPQQTYLQDFMQEFIEFLPEDIEKYLEECKKRVDEFSCYSLKRGFTLPVNVNLSNEEIESLTKRLCGEENKHESLTLSDEEMALIDTQTM